MSCSHDLDAEFLYPGDADIVDIYDDDGDIGVTFALSCPDCGEALSLDASVDSIEEGDFELPFDDDLYD